MEQQKEFARQARRDMMQHLIAAFLQHLLAIQLSCLLVSETWAEARVINLHMPSIHPMHDESYLCTAIRLDWQREEYIVGFKPNASATKVHHILIYGCEKPGKLLRDTPRYVWECGEMNQGDSPDGDIYQSPFEQGPVCAPSLKQTILFAWALDAPAIDLPDHVGFKIAGHTSIRYLVLQVHYGNTTIFKADPDLIDDSGILLDTVHGPHHGITKLAGIYLLLSYGYVTKGLSKHTMECIMNEDKVIHPFRFRTHTHKLGTKVGGYKKSASDSEVVQLIGEHDPQKPQMFYPVNDNDMTISKGDHIYAYCDFNNTRHQTVNIGPTNKDEMCNFYLMYWTDGQELLKNQDCLQYNPQFLGSK